MGSTHATHQIKRKQGYKYADVDEKTGSQHAPTTWKKRRKRHTGALGLLVLRAAALCALNVCRDRIIRFRIVAKIRVVEQKSDGEQFKGKEILLNGAGPLQGWSPNRRAPPLLISRNTSPQTRNHSPRTEGRMTSQCAGEGACQASPHPASDRPQTQRGVGNAVQDTTLCRAVLRLVAQALAQPAGRYCRKKTKEGGVQREAVVCGLVGHMNVPQQQNFSNGHFDRQQMPSTKGLRAVLPATDLGPEGSVGNSVGKCR